MRRIPTLLAAVAAVAAASCTSQPPADTATSAPTTEPPPALAGPADNLSDEADVGRLTVDLSGDTGRTTTITATVTDCIADGDDVIVRASDEVAGHTVDVSATEQDDGSVVTTTTVTTVSGSTLTTSSTLADGNPVDTTTGQPTAAAELTVDDDTVHVTVDTTLQAAGDPGALDTVGTSATVTGEGSCTLQPDASAADPDSTSPENPQTESAEPEPEGSDTGVATPAPEFQLTFARHDGCETAAQCQLDLDAAVVSDDVTSTIDRHWDTLAGLDACTSDSGPDAITVTAVDLADPQLRTATFCLGQAPDQAAGALAELHDSVQR